MIFSYLCARLLRFKFNILWRVRQSDGGIHINVKIVQRAVILNERQ